MTSPTASSSCRSSRSATRCSSRPGSRRRSGSPREARGPSARRLADWLRDKRLLLVLDNFEQVIAAAPVVADLLRAAPDIKAIVTSRAVLHVSGEQEYPVPGLPAPPDPSQMGGLERLNVAGEAADHRPDRARPVRGRPPVHRTCRGRPARVRRDQRQRARGGRHQRPAPRDAAGDRARRGADQAPLAGGHPRPSRPTARRAGRRLARPARAPADAPRRHRLELRAARRQRPASARPAVGVPERLRSRLGGGDLRACLRHRRGHPRRADGARRPEPAQGRGDRQRRFAFPPARHDPGVRRRAARGGRRAGADPGPPSRLVRGPGRPGGGRAVGRRPAALARQARARARRHPGGARPGGGSAGPGDRHRRRVLDVAVLAEARPPRRGPPSARGHGRRTVVARRPAAAREADGGARWHVLVAGRDLHDVPVLHARRWSCG